MQVLERADFGVAEGIEVEEAQFLPGVRVLARFLHLVCERDLAG